jgi:hypothetical protein
MTDLQHFILLAQAGRHAGCSSGERAARLLAMAALKNSIILDTKALAGLLEYIALVQVKPTNASDLVK